MCMCVCVCVWGCLNHILSVLVFSLQSRRQLLGSLMDFGYTVTESQMCRAAKLRDCGISPYLLWPGVWHSLPQCLIYNIGVVLVQLTGLFHRDIRTEHLASAELDGTHEGHYGEPRTSTRCAHHTCVLEATVPDAHSLLVFILPFYLHMEWIYMLTFFTCSLVKVERKDLLNVLLPLGGLVLFITAPHI